MSDTPAGDQAEPQGERPEEKADDGRSDASTARVPGSDPAAVDADPAEANSDPAAANAGAPNDAPGAPSATPGETAPTAHAGQSAPPGSDLPSTEETRAQSSESGGPGAGSPEASLHGCPVTESLGATEVHCNREQYLELCRGLRREGYAMPIGLTGVDYLTHPGRLLPDGIRPERFEVVVELLDMAHHRRVRVRCQVPADDPALPSLFDLWPGTDGHERETYDMFGIRFDGHPDLTRILMPEDWEGHPLRKDYDTGHVPVQFKEAGQR